jgi:hypothetical protein
MAHPRRHGWVLAAALALAVTGQLTLAPVARADTVPSDPTIPPATTPTTPPDSTPTPPPTVPPLGPIAPGAPTVSVPVSIPSLVPGDDAGPPPAPLPDPSPRIRVLLAQIEVVDGEQGVTLATQRLAALEATVDQATAAIARAQQRVGAAETGLESAQSELASVATLAFMGAGGGVLSGVMKGGPGAATQEREMVSATIEHHADVELAAEKELKSARSALARSRRALASAQAQTALGRLDLHSQEMTLTSARADLSGSGRQSTAGWQLSIEGDSAFTGPELAQWFATQGQTSEATVPIDQLTGFYISEGQAEGIRGDMAFAQALVETGSFQNPDTILLNNFAGIGHCDSCASGFKFDSAQLGVRGQMQLLKSFAEKSPTYKNPLVDPRLKGPAGCCQTWTQLTKKWATDPNYGPKILGVYEGMLEWLLTARAAEPGPPPALVVSSSLVATSTTTSTTSPSH